MIFSYIDAISKGFPGVNAYTTGDPNVYENIIGEGGSVLPSKAELDAWILAQTKAHVWEKIKEERDRRKATGAPVDGHWFHSDDTSRIQHIGLVMMGASMPTGIMWKTMTGDFVEMTPALASQIFNTVANRDMQLFATAEQHKAQMLASANPETYDYLTGTPAWLPVFGE